MALDYVVYLVVRGVICLIQALSMRACQDVSEWLAWLCCDVLGVRRKVVQGNLETAFPEASPAERERIARRMWEHLFLMLCEIAHAPRKIHRTNVRRRGSVPEMRALVRMLLDDRPLVIISGHFGNFELGGYLLGMHGFASHTVARPLDNRFLDRFVNRFRGATGQYILPKHGSGEQITELLDRGGTLVLLGDQNAGRRGCWVDFFGRPASTHKAVSVFTLGAGAPTCFCGVARTGGPLELEIRVTSWVDPREEGFDLGTIPLLTQWYTAELETVVRRYPEQYWWLHRRWRDDVRDRRSWVREKRTSQAA